MAAQVAPSSRLPHALPFAQMDIGKQVGIGRPFVVIKANIYSGTIRDDIAGTVADGNIVDKFGSEQKVGEEVVIIPNINRMMSGRLPLGFFGSFRFKDHSVYSAKAPAEKNAAVRIFDTDIPHPAICVSVCCPKSPVMWIYPPAQE